MTETELVGRILGTTALRMQAGTYQLIGVSAIPINETPSPKIVIEYQKFLAPGSVTKVATQVLDPAIATQAQIESTLDFLYSLVA